MVPSDDFRREAFRQETDDVWLVLATLSHPDLSDDIRVVDNWEDITSRGNLYVGLPFEVRLTESTAERPPSATIRIDNISGEITRHLREVDEAVSVKLEVIRAATPDVIEASYAGLKLKEVDVNAVLISGRLALDDLTIEPYPAGTFTPASFPGIF